MSGVLASYLVGSFTIIERIKKIQLFIGFSYQKESEKWEIEA
jgi:hypothetical protein